MKTVIYSLLLLSILAGCKRKEKQLPFLQQEIVGKDTTYRTIPSFKFLNQDSAVVTDKDFDGTIYVADFFFTSCPTICPTMHRNLLKVYKKYLNNPQVKLASHTIDVKYDTPSRMKAYADKLGIKGNQWEFLWGTRDSIYSLAERNYLVSVGQDNKAPGGFVHQGYLILVDKHKRIRGAYDGTVDEQVQQLMDDMDVLLKEQ
ncbi:SCO family protein [Pedobacter hartonius]|uniref:Protein SCO1/2 n=1 Tax=Pedobacter hartonius TaxID=425514 RepID=A0A1H4D7M5_9SPHI|nr:SCO family protein [Pedobacter hartonius]SEA68691.1 protein SCO1/2 [Pedobacter hartonius]